MITRHPKPSRTKAFDPVFSTRYIGRVNGHLNLNLLLANALLTSAAVGF